MVTLCEDDYLVILTPNPPYHPLFREESRETSYVLYGEKDPRSTF